MNRNLIIVILAVILVSLVMSASTLAVKKQTPNANFKSVEEMHEFCEKNPQMRKMMKQHMGEDWEKQHEQMENTMKDHMGDGMMGGSSTSMMSGGSMMY